ncbi:hypothetical protein [Maricaulis sp.]|uniref:hypothetical protein n=1 Tax=Maricaulis sp. TaxID=1486257 RepID=UPI00262A0D90|nr:hypothetical protein [Maricaulis sp.]
MGFALPHWLPRAALEATLIVFAVVLGFLVNEWREDRDSAVEAELALSRIVVELEANLATLETAQAYHEQIGENLAGLEQQLASGELPSEGRLLDIAMSSMPQGISPPILSDVAWTYAGQTGALDQLDFELMAEVARLYSVQELGAETTWQMIAETFFFNEESFELRDVTAKVTFMRLAFVELAAQEDSLIHAYRTVLPQVRELIE